MNVGSSSIKFAVYLLEINNNSLFLRYRGKITNIGQKCDFILTDGEETLLNVSEALRSQTDAITNHNHAFYAIYTWILGRHDEFTLIGIGHRIVHGGENFFSPVLISQKIIDSLKRLIPLAPLHQPHQISAIEALHQHYPEIPQIACFDTAFHRNQPTVAQLFALPRALQQQGIIKYGFHGLSYEYIASVLPEYLNNVAESRVIVAHLGNGASMCAMKALRSIATTMTFSPLDGLPMSTRCGSVDPSVVLYLAKEKRMDIDAISDLLNYKSGLLGVSEISSDMQQLLNSTHPYASQAIDLFVYCVNRELGSLS
jgi:acetate kinase